MPTSTAVRTGWIALPEISASVGQWIEFPDVTPLINFKFKQFGRTFDKIHIIPGIRKFSDQDGTKHSSPDVYRSVDDNGTYVFTNKTSKTLVNIHR